MLFAVAGMALALWVFLLFQTWSTVPFWPDAAGYTSHVEEGRWIAHPPGYLFFVVVGRTFHVLGLPSYPAVQSASVFLALLSCFLLFFLFRRTCRLPDALLLTIAFAFSWIVLLLSRTGTSHAGDLATTSLLLLVATSEGFRSYRPSSLFLYGLGIVLCAGMRLNSAIMLMPFFAIVLIRHWRSGAVWMTYVMAGLAVIVVQAGVIHLYGGWEPYMETTRAFHLSNKQSSLLGGGFHGPALLNLARAFGWWVLSLSFLLLLPFMASRKQPLSLNQREFLLYGGGMATGVLAVSGLYLCTHPGFLCPALPGTFVCLAAILPLVSHWFWKPAVFVSYLILTLGFFLLARPFISPSTPRQAMANGLLLQYSAFGLRHALFKTTSEWLRLAGYDSLVPQHRRNALDVEAAGRKIP